MRLIGTLGAAALLLLAACAPTPGTAPANDGDTPERPAATDTASDEATGNPDAEPVALAGTSWEIVAIDGAETVASARPTIHFTDDQYDGHSGCNNFGGGYTQDGGAVSLGEAFSTLMACPDDAVSQQETALYAALPTVAGARAVDDGAELTDAAGQAVLTLAAKAPEEDLPLESTVWELTGIAQGDAVSSVVGEEPVTLVIADGKINAKACNVINGEVKVDGTELQVGPLASTRMSCPSEEETIQEGEFMAALESATSAHIEGSHLALTTAEGSLLFAAMQDR